MASKTKQILKTRESIVALVDSYLYTARGIEDIQKEGDFSDFEDCLDEILEKHHEQAT